MMDKKEIQKRIAKIKSSSERALEKARAVKRSNAVAETRKRINLRKQGTRLSLTKEDIQVKLGAKQVKGVRQALRYQAKIQPSQPSAATQPSAAAQPIAPLPVVRGASQGGLMMKPPTASTSVSPRVKLITPIRIHIPTPAVPIPSWLFQPPATVQTARQATATAQIQTPSTPSKTPTIGLASEDFIKLPSSWIDWSKYSTKLKLLLIRLKNGKIMRYAHIPEGFIFAFQNGLAPCQTNDYTGQRRWYKGKIPSLGAAWHQYIKPIGGDQR